MSNEICQTVLVCQNNRYSNVDKFYQKNISLLYILRIYSNTYINMCLKYRNTCSVTLHHRIEINRKATRVGTFEVCVSTHVSLRIFIMQVLASQLPFLANRNTELAVPPLFWPDNCIKIGGHDRHVAMPSGPTVYTLYCAYTFYQSPGSKLRLRQSPGSN